MRFYPVPVDHSPYRSHPSPMRDGVSGGGGEGWEGTSSTVGHLRLTDFGTVKGVSDHLVSIDPSNYESPLYYPLPRDSPLPWFLYDDKWYTRTSPSYTDYYWSTRDS